VVQYRVFLDSPPSAGEIVTITPSVWDSTEDTVGAPIQFDTSNWGVPQYINVTPGASGDGNDGNVANVIDHTVTSNQVGGNYGGVLAPSVNLTNINIDGIAMISVSPGSGFFVQEGGGSQTITISAGPDVTPAADVTVNLTNNAPTQVTLSAASVVLNAGNGYSATVTVTAIDDAAADGNVPFSITTAAATSADAAFNGLDPADIDGYADDNDVAAISVTPNSAISVTEGGAGQVITIAAQGALPAADVTVNLTNNTPTQVTLSAASVVLNAGNGYSATATVTAIDDAAADGNVPFSITTAAATSADAGFNGLDPADISGDAIDNDVAAISVTPNSAISVTEGGAGQVITIAAQGALPAADVTVNLTNNTPTQVTLSAASVVLNAGNGYSATVTVTAIDDAAVDGNVPFSITTAAATSADAAFDGLDPADISGDAIDNDVTPTAIPTLSEWGMLLLASLLASGSFFMLRRRRP
jgi:hypothetical protein